MTSSYKFQKEKAHNQSLADQINATWAARGKRAGAKAVPLMVDGGHRKSRKYFTVISNLENGRPMASA